ncbi:MAG: hypothetical protein DIU64_003095 [Caldicoprobacter oshimai]
MRIIYEGVDITEAIEVKKADIIDNAGGVADSIELWFDDPQGFWSQWQPQKNHRVELKEGGFDSGVMYVDELEQKRGFFIIRALSIPQEAKTDRTKSWENIRFMELANELAAKYGFPLETYGVQNYLYQRVDQYEQADFEFLAWRCMLEGYALKIAGEKVIIYSEKYIESQAPAKTLYIDQFDGDFGFRIKATGIFGACRVSYGDISYEFRPAGTLGPTMQITDIYVSSQGEAERFAKNLLRAKNKYEHTGYCTIELDPGIAAGTVLQIAGVGLADGKYFCEQTVHRLVERKTFLRLRRPVEGY